MKKLIISILLMFLIFTTMWAVANREHLLSFTTIVSAYYAKEYCSCRYVVGRTESECHNTVRSFIDISSFKDNADNKTVSVSGLGQSSQARFIDERSGCILLNEE